MKRTIIRIILLLCCLTFILGTVGCGLMDYLPEFESGYFRYAVRTENGKREGYLVGLTELGAEQTELILPQEIDGVPIVGIGYRRKGGGLTDDGYEGSLVSNNLNKLYIPFSAKDWTFVHREYLPNSYCVVISDLVSLGSAGDIVSYPIYSKITNPEIYRTNETRRRTLLANVSFM